MFNLSGFVMPNARSEPVLNGFVLMINAWLLTLMGLGFLDVFGARLWLIPSSDNRGVIKVNYRCNITIAATKPLIK
jgi:hypothetical protein